VPGRHERPLVVGLLALHLALVLWGAGLNSVTFDENFHLPSGVLIVARRNFDVSEVNPPLIKALQALPPLLLGAALPDSGAVASRIQEVVGESFMRRNASRYHWLYFSARCVTALLSVLLALAVRRLAGRLYGPGAGLVALAFYVANSEALAHGGLATLDVATGLAFVLALEAYFGFARTGRAREWTALALAVAGAFLTRFSTIALVPVLAVVTAVAALSRQLRRPARVWLGLLLIAPFALLALQAGYLGRTSFRPLAQWTFMSRPFLALQHAAPRLTLPLPDALVRGLDHQSFSAEPGRLPTYLDGRVRYDRVRSYFPRALAVKWPLAFLLALALRAALAARLRLARGRGLRGALLATPVAALAGIAMFGPNLNAGVRYLFPIVPIACVWLGGLTAHPARVPTGRRAELVHWALAGWLLAAAQAVEVAPVGPWYLSFFNRMAGGPGRGDFVVNDSNVDWGQGLIALKREMDRRGIRRIHLAYHGTTDPALYGIDYVPYLGGEPGPESDWLAVSSYYFVGLPQAMMTPRGRTALAQKFDFHAAWNVPPAARPAGCMYLFHLPERRGPR
jgi:hypothetical protein